MSEGERIVAVRLLSERDLERLGSAFTRAYRIDETPCFVELLHAIDLADRDFRLQQEGLPRSEASTEKPEG